MERGSAPGPSQRSDEDLLREHGINRDCRVVISPVVDSGNAPSNEGNQADESSHSDEDSPPKPPKEFKVHYGLQYLSQLAHELAFRYHLRNVNMDRVYSTFIPSQFSTLDRQNFKSILQSYCQKWEATFRERRLELLRKKVEEVRAKREANRMVRLTYHDEQIICRKGDAEQTKLAWKGGRRSRVVLERISMNQAQGVAAPAIVPPVAPPQSPSVSGSQPGSLLGDWRDLPSSSTSHLSMISPLRDSPPLLFGYVGNESIEDRRTAIDGVIRDMIAKVSDEQDHGDGAGTQDMSSTDCYSGDTVESPMEVEFGSGESPDFSKVLRDSEETCHGDEFFEVAGAGQQQGLPGGSADRGSGAGRGTNTRSPDKSITFGKSTKL